MEKIKQEINNITKLFNFDIISDSKNFFLFLSYIKSISKPDLTICQKETSLGYRCYDCQNDSLSYVCTDCFDKSKHINHRYEILTGNGFCDCGDISMLKKEAFCSKHNGYFTDYNDMMNYVKKCFEENIIKKLDNILNNIFKLFIEYINIYYNENSDFENKKKIENEIFEMLDEFIIFYTKIKEHNLALFYLIIFKFTENFSYETNHKCFNYDSNKRLINIIPKSEVKHKCICPFYQIVINLLLIKQTKYNSEEFFSYFMLTIKNKLIVSLSFMHTFPELFYNKNLSILLEIIFQICTKDLAELIYEEKNIFFFEECLNSIYNETIKEILELKNYGALYKLFDSLGQFLRLFPTKEINSKIKYYYKIHGIIINIICSIHNIINFDKFQNVKYYSVFDCEYIGLVIISYLSHFFDFDNIDSLNFIFNNFFEKLSQVKANKEANNIFDENNNIIKSYSPFLTLYRAFSIFLNRFCFYYSTKNGIDLIIAFNFFNQIFPRFQTSRIFLFLYQELINNFGFIIYLDKFSSNSNNILYIKNYFSERIYILADITLMKYLLLLPEVQNNFNVNYIIDNTNVFSSNSYFVYLNINELKKKNSRKENLISAIQINLKYINSVLKFIYYLIRDNSSMIYLAFNYMIDFRMEYKDEVLNILLENDKSNLYEVIKNKIRIFILSQKNSIANNDINNTQLNYDLIKDIISQIIEEDCFKQISNDKHLFSIKKEKLNICDIDYCYEKEGFNNLTQYLTEFQANNFNLLHTYISANISIQENLYNKLCDLFFNEENIKSFLEFYTILITKDNYPLLKDIFFFDFSKILCFYIISTGIQNINRTLKSKLIRLLIKNKIKNTDKDIKYIEYIKKLLEIEEQPAKKIDTNDIKAKNKNLFKKKLNTFSEKFHIFLGNDEKKMDIDEQKEICQYCKNEINKNNLYNYYGIICNLSTDYFIDIIRKKPRKKRMISRRILTCKHKIHFDCFFKLNQNTNDINKILFKCPVCSRQSNFFICDFISLAQLNIDIIQGMSLGENNLEAFYHFNEDNIDKSFANINRIFFENYCSKMLNKPIKVENLIENNFIQDILDRLLLDFNTANIYYTLTTYKNEQIIIWKNILYTFRYLFKSKIIFSTDNIISDFNSIFNDIKNYNTDILNILNISYIIDKFIILLFILYDLNQENKDEITKLFRNNILLLIFFNFYMENKENSENFFENEMILNKAFELYELKYTIFFSLFNWPLIQEKNDFNFTEAINFVKSSDIFKNLIHKFNSDNSIKKEKDKFLEIPKFEIIELPNDYNAFIEKYINIKCTNCNQIRKKYLICLFCGAKICNDKNCIMKYKEQDCYSVFIHSKLCTNNQGFFITNDSNIIFVLKDKIIQGKNINNFIYLNSHGENYQPNKSRDLKTDYVLKNNLLKEIVQKYIDMNFGI